MGLNDFIGTVANIHLKAVEDATGRDCLAFYGPVRAGVDGLIRAALESLEGSKGDRLAVLVETPGGVVEVVERMVETIRHHYPGDVTMIIPDTAMSAGTILAMSGDSIQMDYFSRLGPIDPQLERGDRMVPALSYLVQYERLIDKDRNGGLTSAEFALLAKFDLAELHMFEQARDLSVSLLRRWLATYKFKDWVSTETAGTPVDQSMREKRAEEIARLLSDNKIWHSHGRGISRDTLEKLVNLRIDKLEADPRVHIAVRQYHDLITELQHQRNRQIAVHTREFFLC
jgi:hypothetical protein